MRWEDRLAVLRWRSVEEADATGAVFSGELRKAATLAALGDQDFLVARARHLDETSPPGVLAMAETLRTPVLPSWPRWLLFSGAAVLGYALTELGERGQINLLALPLVVILLWNVLVFATSMLGIIGPQQPPAWLLAWFRRKDRGALRVFQERALPFSALSASISVKQWLHLGALFLALGSIAGLYAKGWSTEYRAVWESTLLDEEGARRFFALLFAPAAKVFGLGIPLDELAEMRAGAGRPDVVGASALPWIHLYAGTLVLVAVLPRLVLAGLTWVRGRLALDAMWRRMGWVDYEERLRRAVSGAGEHVWMLLHGWRPQDEQRDRWSEAVEQHLGGQVQIEHLHVPAGEEDEFVGSWSPREGAVVLVFNASSTPEVEVQARLAEEIRQRSDGARVVALVDALPLRQRRAELGVASRLDLWRQVMTGRVDELWITGEEHAV